MAKIDETTEKVLKQYMPKGYDLKKAVWALERGGKVVAWIAKHKALEVAASHNNIKFDAPVIIESSAEKKVAVMLVTGHFGDKTEWSIGESTTYNTKNTYPFAMAEKRAKDRVILKLLGLHGDLYSSEEADEFKESEPSYANPIPSKSDSLDMDVSTYELALKEVEEFKRAFDEAKTEAELDGMRAHYKQLHSLIKYQYPLLTKEIEEHVTKG